MLATSAVHYKIKIAISLLIISFLFQSKCTSGENKPGKENPKKQAALQIGNRLEKSDTTLIPSQAKTNLKETIFIFEAKETLSTDSITIIGFTKAINGRLKGLYYRPVPKEDIEIAGSKNVSIPSSLYLKLYGSFDSTAVVQALNRKMNSSDFLMLKGDTAVSGIRKQIDRLQKTSISPVLLSSENNTGYPANKTGEIATGTQKDTIAIKKLLMQITIPAGKRLYLDDGKSQEYGTPVRLYLVDISPLITANEVLSCSLQFEYHYPGIGIALNETGKEKLAAFTRQNIGRTLAIVIKGDMLSSGIITSEIPNGYLSLNGGMSVKYVNYFLNKLDFPYPYPVPLNFTGFKK